MDELTLGNRPAAVTGLSLFFAFGVLACTLSAALLLHPGTPLDAVWRLNPRGHEGIVRLGPWAFAGLASVAVACALAAIGLWKGRIWGRRLAVAILATNLIGDLVNAVLGDPRGWIGVPVAGGLIAYLLASPRVKLFFGDTRGSARPRDE